ADSLWDEIKNKKSGVEKSSSTAMMKKMENPPPSFYRLSLKDTVSKTEHRESLQKEEESQLTYSSAPFYNMDGFNFRDSTKVFMDMSSIKSRAYMGVPKEEFHWQKTDRDSTIQGIKVKLRIGEKEDSQIKAWITEEFHPDLNIHNIYNP